MLLTLLTPKKKLLVDTAVDYVVVPGENGEMEVLPGHSPLMTVMKTGVLRYKTTTGQEEKVAISWGYCEVSPTGVNVLAETAETAGEIDLARAKEAEEKANSQLDQADADIKLVEKNLEKIKRSQVRQEVAQ